MGNILPLRPRRPPQRKRASLACALLRHFGFCTLAIVTVAAGYHFLTPSPSRQSVAFRNDSAPRAASNRGSLGPKTELPIERRRIASGRDAVVIDGDSLRIGSERIRLVGIDAPELHQTCRSRNKHEWACGQAAHERLADLVAGREVICTEHGRDRYGRMLAVCAAGDVRDLGEMQVLTGHAINYDRYSDRYRDAEERARTIRRGIWSGVFENPETWRAAHPRGETTGWDGR